MPHFVQSPDPALDKVRKSVDHQGVHPLPRVPWHAARCGHVPGVAGGEDAQQGHGSLRRQARSVQLSEAFAKAGPPLHGAGVLSGGRRQQG